MEDKELTFEDLKQRGIDTSTIKVCRTIRNLAKLERLQLDISDHKNNLNKHLFDYIAYCNRDNGKSDIENVRDFIIEYLSNLQPYMIERFKSQEFDSNIICVLDNLYKISVYIKVDKTQYKELIVSFHESHKNGIAKQNNLIKYNRNEFVPVFADSILSKSNNNYTVKVFIQRGLMILPIELPAWKCQDIWVVRRATIENQLLEWCNTYISDLYTSDLEIEVSKISLFTILQQISFTSYGKDTFSTLSILVDSWNIQNNYISKKAADLALITYAQNLKLSNEQVKELEDLLTDKYSVTSMKNTAHLLQRISDALNYTAIEEDEIDDEMVNAYMVNQLIENNNE